MTLQPKTYEVLTKAVEDGVAYGITRAFKYFEGSSMTFDELQEKRDEIAQQVLNSIMEWFDIKDEERPK